MFLSRNTLTKWQTFSKLYHSGSKNQSYEEIRIPVPWGHLAGKWWGPQDRRPILMLHGWQDNCGSFDRLIPCLNKNLAFLSIDHPGHGLSSPLPLGAAYHWMEYVCVVRRVVNYFEWQKISIMGHSLSGIVGYLYATLYPESMDFLITFDALKPLIFNKNKFNYMGKEIDRFLKYDRFYNSTIEPPSYSLQELKEKLHHGCEKSISLEVCKNILERNITQSVKEPHKYYFQRDPRLKVLPLIDFDYDQIISDAKRLTCPTLLCLSKHRAPKFNILPDLEDLCEAIKRTNKNFVVQEIDGNHHVHYNNPELVEAYVNEFIEKFNTEDKSVGGLKEGMRLACRC